MGFKFLKHFCSPRTTSNRNGHTGQCSSTSVPWTRRHTKMLCCRSSEVCSTLSSAVKVNSFLVTISNRECRKDLFLKVVLELEKTSILILQATNAQVLKSDVLQLFSIPSCSYFCSQFAAWTVLLCHLWDVPEGGRLCQTQDCAAGSSITYF